MQNIYDDLSGFIVDSDDVAADYISMVFFRLFEDDYFVVLDTGTIHELQHIPYAKDLGWHSYLDRNGVRDLLDNLRLFMDEADHGKIRSVVLHAMRHAVASDVYDKIGSITLRWRQCAGSDRRLLCL